VGKVFCENASGDVPTTTTSESAGPRPPRTPHIHSVWSEDEDEQQKMRSPVPQTPVIHSVWSEDEEDQAPVANSARARPNFFSAQANPTAVSPPPGLGQVVVDEPMAAPEPVLGEGYARRLAEAVARDTSVDGRPQSSCKSTGSFPRFCQPPTPK